MLFATVMNAACAFQSASLTLINASRTSTRITVPCAEKICSLPASRRKICLAVMLSMLTVLENWPVLIIVVLSAKRRLSRSNPWQLHGRLVPGILRSIPCLVTCSVLSTLCATIVKRRVIGETGIFWVYSAHNAVPSIQWSSRC